MATLLEKLPVLQTLLNKLYTDASESTPLPAAETATPEVDSDDLAAVILNGWREVAVRLKDWFEQLPLMSTLKTEKSTPDVNPGEPLVSSAGLTTESDRSVSEPVPVSASMQNDPSNKAHELVVTTPSLSAATGGGSTNSERSVSSMDGYRNMAGLLGLASVLPLTDRPDGPKLTLRETQLLARTQSTDVEAAIQRLSAFGFARDAALGALLPQADASAGMGIGDNTAVTPHLRLPRRESNLTVRQVLVDESLRRTFGQKRQLIVSAEQQLESAVSQSLLESGGAYMEALRLRVNIELSLTHERRLDELLRYVSDRAAAGGASAAERERVKSRVANLRSSIADNRSSLAVALRNLYRVTGLEPGALTLDEPLPSLEIDAAAQAVAQAMRHNPELRAARAEVDAAEQDIGVQRARHLPRVDMALTRNQSVNAAGTEGHIQDTKVMVNVSIPLFHGGSDEAQVNAAVARQLELDSRARGVERRLTMEIESAYANLTAAATRFDSVRDEMESNRKVVEAFQAQLVGGNRPLLDVLDAYQRFYQSQLDLVQLLVSEAQTRMRLCHLTGSLLQATVNVSAIPARPLAID